MNTKHTSKSMLKTFFLLGIMSIAAFFALNISPSAAQAAETSSPATVIGTESGTAVEKPIRIAILPTIGKKEIPDELRTMLAKKLDDTIHVPLNGVLNKVEYIPEDTINEAVKKLHVETFDGYSAAVMPNLAKELDADIVIGFVVNRYDEILYRRHTMWSRYGSDLYVASNVDMDIVGYERKLDQDMSAGARRSYDDEYTTNGTALSLASEIADTLIKKSEITRVIFPNLKD